MNRNLFEEKIKPVLKYVGGIGAAFMCVAYIIIVFVLIKGFKVEDVLSITVFAIVNAVVGLIIMQFLKIQGISFAKDIPENKIISDRYYRNKTKDKKSHSIKFYWATTIPKDILVKGLTLCASTIGVIYIVVKGSNDYNLLLLAFVNLIMFICFGMLSLVNAYDFYNERHIPFLKERIEENESTIVEVSANAEGD